MRKFLPWLAVLMVLASVPVHAQDCDTVVVDDAGLLVNVAGVRTAAETLAQQLGADVRVRTWRALDGESTLPPYAHRVRRSCPSWQNPSRSDFRSNLILVAFSMEPRRVGIIAGSDFAAFADAHHLRIEQKVIAPRFRSKDFDGGIIAGLEEFGRVVAAAPQEVASTPAPVPVVVQTQPTDWSWVGPIIRDGFSIFLVLGGIVIVVFVVHNVRRSRKERRRAQSEAREARAECVTAHSNTEAALNDLETEYAAALANFTKEDLAEAATSIKDARQALGDALTGYSEMSAYNSPDQAGTTDDYRRRTEAFMKASKAFNAADALRKKAQEKLREAVARPERVKSGVVGLKTSADAVAALIEGAKPEFAALAATHDPTSWESIRGNGTEASNRLGSVLREIPVLESLIADRKWKDAELDIAAGVKLLDEASSLLRSITERRKHLDLLISEVPEGLTKARAEIDAARAFVQSHDADIDDQAWADLDAAEEGVTAVEKGLHAAKPHYPHLAHALTKARERTDAIMAGAREQHETAQRLREQDAEGLRDVERAIAKAKEYREDHVGDVGDASRIILDAAERKLAQAKAEQSLVKRIVLFKETYQLADQSFKKAEADFKDAEKARRRSRSSGSRYSGGGDTTVLVNNQSWGSPWPSSPASTYKPSSTSSFSSGFSGGGDSGFSFGGGSAGSSGGGDSGW